MNALEFNNKIANLIITNIPTIGQFDPNNERPNKDFIPIIELVNLNYQLNPNDHSSQLNITLRNTMDSKGIGIPKEPLQNKVNQFVQNFIDNLTELAGLHLITISTGTSLKIYQHLVMGDTLTYHQSDFNYYITYSQYLD